MFDSDPFPVAEEENATGFIAEGFSDMGTRAHMRAHRAFSWAQGTNVSDIERRLFERMAERFWEHAALMTKVAER